MKPPRRTRPREIRLPEHHTLFAHAVPGVQFSGGEGEKIRTRLAAEVLDEALRALENDIDIAIYDASNINKKRRSFVKDSVAASGLHAKASELWEGGQNRERGWLLSMKHLTVFFS